VLVYSHSITPRLKYIIDFIEDQLLGKNISDKKITITSDKEFFAKDNGPKINYSNEKISDSEFWIQNSDLLFEKGLREQTIECFETDGYKAFFKTNGDFSFDIFAAIFYLLTRYEEYLPHKKDFYGRYGYENSLAFKKNFLHLPLVNIWLQDFKKKLQEKFSSIFFRTASFGFIPTYDIDIAYSYLHKGFVRSTGKILKLIVQGNLSPVVDQINVLRQRKKDPFDSYEWINDLHSQYHLKSHYFFLVAKKNSKYDKNISPEKKAMQKLIESHSINQIGIHPSWQSGNNARKLKFEILKLGHISGKQILSSRQHYIRFTLPETFRQLINAGIEEDFSMGYGSINGFRASVASPFYWYDLEKEEKTKLLLYPFCFMDANSFFEQKFSPQQALEEMRQYYHSIKSINGTMITIWHNTFLGTGKLFAGWKEIYQQFISEVIASQPQS
jgi:hypothetical protein